MFPHPIRTRPHPRPLDIRDDLVGARPPDAALALEMLDTIPACAGSRDRTRYRLVALQGDGAHEIKAIVRRRIVSLLVPTGKARKEPGSGLGKTRDVVDELAECLIYASRIEQLDLTGL